MNDPRMNLEDEQEPGSPQTRTRKRTAHACDSCRLRKSRCDGRNPCSNCRTHGYECLYGETVPMSYSKSDLILRTVLRMDGLLQDIQKGLQSKEPEHAAPSASTNGSGDSGIMANATIPSSHLSATENLLSTPLASTMPSLREIFQPIYQMETSREPIPFRPSLMHPMLRPAEAERLFNIFASEWNFWYPVVSYDTLQKLLKIAQRGGYDHSEDSCATLLVLALGSAADILYYEMESTDSDAKSLSEVCFDSAAKLLPMIMMQFTTLSTQCTFLAGMYCLFLQRPLQAWSYLHASGARCRVQLSYSRNNDTSDEECIRRIFWSCYIIESDLIAELSLLPQSGVQEMESQVRLPGPLQTHASEDETERSALYLMACISMRRLLNRVHNLLYSSPRAHALSPGSNDSREEPFSRMVYELDLQLQRWHSSLPDYLRFESETGPVENEHQGFLRQRFLTCKHIIYRSYLEYVVEHEGMVHSQDTLDACKKCLEATCLHISNLRSFKQTVMVDTWICSLSMTSAMFVLLTSLKFPALRGLALPDLPRYGSHLTGLLSHWITIPPQQSPSVKQSIDLILELDRLIQLELQYKAPYPQQ